MTDPGSTDLAGAAYFAAGDALPGHGFQPGDEISEEELAWAAAQRRRRETEEGDDERASH